MTNTPVPFKGVRLLRLRAETFVSGFLILPNPAMFKINMESLSQLSDPSSLEAPIGTQYGKLSRPL